MDLHPKHQVGCAIHHQRIPTVRVDQGRKQGRRVLRSLGKGRLPPIVRSSARIEPLLNSLNMCRSCSILRPQSAFVLSCSAIAADPVAHVPVPDEDVGPAPNFEWHSPIYFYYLVFGNG